MRKLLFLLLVLTFATNVIASDNSQEYYKQELLDKGYLFGCAPANWSLVEPIRGGFNYAIMKNRVDIMELEVKAGLNPVDCGKNAVNAAIMYKKSAPLDFLLKNGFSADTVGIDHSFLTFAIYRKNLDAVRILIENGADVNMVAKGKHPLNSAIKKKQPEIVKMLLDAGAKPNNKTFELVRKSKSPEIKNMFKQFKLN